MKQTRVIFRSSITGRIVRPWVAQSYPKTTEREVIKVVPPKPKA